jgi:hypothetical protein
MDEEHFWGIYGAFGDAIGSIRVWFLELPVAVYLLRLLLNLIDQKLYLCNFEEVY